MVDTVNSLGGLPTRNFSQGEFKSASEINGVALYNRIKQRNGDPSHACMPGCLIKSSNIYCDHSGNEVVRSLEYETVVLCGPNLGISDLDAIAKFNLEINKLGLDSIDVGVAMGILMDCGVYEFGDIDGVLDMLNEVKRNTPLGRIIGSGAAITGKILGAKRVPVAKGQAFAAYDPRVVKGHGVTFSTSAMGADHTAGMNIREKLDPRSKEGQIKSSKHVQKLAAIYDSLGLCLFVHVAVRDRTDIITNMINAIYGCKWTEQDLFALAEDTLKTEIQFNRAAGLSEATDCLPEIFTEEHLPPSDNVFDITSEELLGIHEL